MQFPVGSKVKLPENAFYPNEEGEVIDYLGNLRIVRVPPQYKGDDGLREVEANKLRDC